MLLKSFKLWLLYTYRKGDKLRNDVTVDVNDELPIYRYVDNKKIDVSIVK